MVEFFLIILPLEFVIWKKQIMKFLYFFIIFEWFVNIIDYRKCTLIIYNMIIKKLKKIKINMKYNQVENQYNWLSKST